MRNRFTKTVYRNCQKMTATRQANIQKRKERRERNKAKGAKPPPVTSS